METLFGDGVPSGESDYATASDKAIGELAMLGFGAIGEAPLGALPAHPLAAILAEEKRSSMPYYAAFGRFIAAFALAEAGAHIAARHYSTLDDEKARLMFSGMRLTDLAGKLRALARVSKKGFEDIDACLTQLDLISKERDKLVHRYVSFDRTLGLRVTNYLTVKSPELVEKNSFGIETMENMERDCKSIFLRLAMHSPNPPSAGIVDISISGSYGPWLYKRPPQTSRPKRHR